MGMGGIDEHSYIPCGYLFQFVTGLEVGPPVLDRLTISRTASLSFNRWSGFLTPSSRSNSESVRFCRVGG